MIFIINEGFECLFCVKATQLDLVAGLMVGAFSIIVLYILIYLNKGIYWHFTHPNL